MALRSHFQPLYRKFFEEAKSNFEIAKTLIDQNSTVSALYNLQQSFEKTVKSIYIFKSMNIDGLSENEAYKKAVALRHDVQKSVIDLIIEIGEYEKKILQNSGSLTKDPTLLNAQQKNINAINGFLDSAKALPNKLRLAENFINNINNYAAHVTTYYTKYTEINLEVNTFATFSFLRLISCVGALYPCLYKMDTITRYPSNEFNYENLELLKNQSSACKMIREMLDSLITIVGNEINSEAEI